ncbi:armadillo-type protein [Mycena latifolia]|nr:armadillo-type protein [Mycena latifolia]
MLMYPLEEIQQHALDVVIGLSQHDVPRAMILTTENIETINGMLGDQEWQTRRSALRTLEALIQYNDVREVLSRQQMIDRTIQLLRDPFYDVRRSAIDVVIALAKLDVGTLILTPETIQKIIAMPQDPDSSVGQSALDALYALASNENFTSLILTPHHLVHVLYTMSGGDHDSHIISFTEKILALEHDIPTITISLTNTIVKGIVQAAPTVRKSYCKVIRLLPLSSVTIPLENAEKLFDMLKNPDADIANSAIEIISYSTANAQFRQHILTSYFWALTVNLLQHPPTARRALNMVTELVKYDDTRREVIQSSGIVHTLLNMLKSGTADIDRWEVGLKGLLALGLF